MGVVVFTGGFIITFKITQTDVVKVRHVKDAQAAFYEVVKKTKGDKEKSHLNRQSKRDFVKAYAETGEAKRAYNAFAKLDKGYAFDMLMLLGDLYMAGYVGDALPGCTNQGGWDAFVSRFEFGDWSRYGVGSTPGPGNVTPTLKGRGGFSSYDLRLTCQASRVNPNRNRPAEPHDRSPELANFLFSRSMATLRCSSPSPRAIV